MNYKLLGIPQPEYNAIEQVFFNRGIDPEKIEEYLHTTDAVINDYQWFGRFTLEYAFNALKETIDNNKECVIIVDCDVDGYTSAAALANYLYLLNEEWTKTHIHFIHHGGKAHGLEDAVMEQILDIQPHLVIIPDAGSSDVEQCKTLKDAGTRIIILDHHHSDTINPYAIVINNQLCDYPNKFLSGVGVVWQFLRYVDKQLGLKNANRFLDLVAIGLVSDMMSLLALETRHLIFEGLAALKNPFVKEMISSQAYSINKHGELDPFCVSFYVAPFVNATTRVGTQEEKELLFNSMLEWRGNDIVPSTKRGAKGETERLCTQAVRVIKNIKNRQERMNEAANEKIVEIIEKNNLDDNKVLVICLPKEEAISRGLTGLFANKIAARYGKPVLLLNDCGDSWAGSGRAPGRTQLESFRDFLITSRLVEMAQGHDNAFGVEIKKDKIDEFIRYSNAALANFSFGAMYKVDVIYSGGNFNFHDIVNIAELGGIWGQDMDEPYIAIEGIAISKNNTTLMSPDKYPTLKIDLANGVSLIKFGSSVEEYQRLLNNGVGSIITVVGKCAVDRKYHVGQPQVLVEDYEITLNFCF